MKSYLLNKEYLHKMIDDLPDLVQVDDSGQIFYNGRRNSVELGEMGEDESFSLFCPPWAAMRMDAGRKIEMTPQKIFACCIKQARENFDSYATITEKINGRKIRLHCVGRNASHEFWLGFMDGKFVRMVCGEVVDKYGILTSKDKVFTNLDEPGYLGHW